MSRIKKSTLTFLKDLSKNNDREWFKENKTRYEAGRENVAEFAHVLLSRMNETDVLSTENGKKSLFRIYRDVRFSKNKDPYKTNYAGQFVRDGKLRRGGYYYNISPVGEWRSFIGGGFYGMEKDDLKRMREELAVDASELRAIIADKDFVRIFGKLQGEQLKTAPRGYAKDHENIDLLRYKQFYAGRNFTDKEVLSENFIDQAHEAMLALRPFFDHFTEVLTTDANGELVV